MIYGDKHKRRVVEFKEEWFERAKEIKGNPLPPDEARKIKREYEIHKTKFQMFIPRFVWDVDMYNMLSSTDSEIQTALSIAVSKYKETEKPIRKSKIDAFKELIKKIKIPF